MQHTAGRIGTTTATLHKASRKPPPARRQLVSVRNRRTLVFPTNGCALPALTITELDLCRWQVELFFKWIKGVPAYQVLFGTSGKRSQNDPHVLRLEVGAGS